MFFTRGRIYKLEQGSETVSNSTADATLITAPGAGKRIVVNSVFITVHTAAVGGGGLIQLEDGLNGKAFCICDADAVGDHIFYLGEDGYVLSENTLLNLTVLGAATTQASGSAVIQGSVAIS